MNRDQAARHRRNAFAVLESSSYFASETGGLAWVMQCLDAGVAQAGQPVIFRHLGDEGAESVFEVGRYGGGTQVLRTPLRGVWWLWAAVDDRQRTNTLRASDLSAPWASAASDSARKAIRRDAAAFFKRVGMRELDQAASYISVTGGVIHYNPPGNAVPILTR